MEALDSAEPRTASTVNRLFRVLAVAALALTVASPAWAVAGAVAGSRDLRGQPAESRDSTDRLDPGSSPDNGEERPETDPTPAAPPNDPCEALTDPGERLDCKAEKLHGQVSRAVDSLTASDSDLLTDRQKGLLRNARHRAARERERTGPAGFKRLAKKREVDCFVQEFDDATGTDPDDDGNNDGVCDKGELCEEVNTDQIGDNDSKCEKFKEKKGKPIWEPCVEICDPDVIDADDDNFDEAIGRDAESTFDDSAVLLADLNDQLESRVSWGGMTSAGATAAVDGDACSDLLVGTREFPYVILQTAQAAANVVKTANDSCIDASRQSSSGFNFSAACVPFAVDMNVIQLAQDAFELQDDSVTGGRVDTAAGCLELLGIEVKENNDKVDGIADELEQARTRIEARLDELIRLLNTPAGRRPEYPLPTGGKP